MPLPSKLPDSELAEYNKWLKDKYGMFDVLKPMWRVVWSEDQLEYRSGTFEDRTKEGDLKGIFTGVRQVRKYQYAEPRYVLERCFSVPDTNKELVEKYSYEPVWTFQSRIKKEFLPLDYDALWYIIESVYAKAAQSVGARYKDPDSTLRDMQENKKERVRKIREALYGNETNIGDALMQQSGVSISNTDMLVKEN